MIQFFQKIWHLIGTALSFAFFGVWGVCLAWIVLPLCYSRTPGSVLDKSLACRRQVSVSFRTLFRLMCWFKIFDFSEQPSPEALPEDKRFILIANHPSLVDTAALLACFPELIVVAQSYMFNNPLLGPILRRCQFIDGGDGSPFSGAAVISASIERLQSGQPILIFPEGTRSGWSGLGTFRRGAFEMAQRAGVPILPTFITTQPRTLMKGMRWYRIPVERVTFRIELGALISSEPDEDVRQMTKRAQALYESRLTELGMLRATESRQQSGTAIEPGSPASTQSITAHAVTDEPHPSAVEVSTA